METSNETGWEAGLGPVKLHQGGEPSGGSLAPNTPYLVYNTDAAGRGLPADTASAAQA